MSSRVLKQATGILLGSDQYQVGWTPIELEHTGEKTYAIAILAKQEINATLEPLFLVMAEEDSTHSSTRGYTPYPIKANQEYMTKGLRTIVIQQRSILQNRTSVTLAGIPAGVNIFSMTPPRSYLDGDDGLENLKMIVQIFYGATATINGQIVQSPVHKVTQDESG